MKKWMNYLGGLCVLAICLANSTQGQSVEAQRKRQYVIAPSEIAMAAAAVQPASPVEFVDTQLLIDINTGHWTPSFKLRNRGTKAIRAFTVGFGSEQRGWKVDNPKDFLMPGRVTSLRDDEEAEIVPLTQAIREKSKLTGPMQGIYMLIVVDVEYADGSRFEEAGYEPVQDYLSTVNSLYHDFLRKSSTSSLMEKQKQ